MHDESLSNQDCQAGIEGGLVTGYACPRDNQLYSLVCIRTYREKACPARGKAFRVPKRREPGFSWPPQL